MLDLLKIQVNVVNIQTSAGSSPLPVLTPRPAWKAAAAPPFLGLHWVAHTWSGSTTQGLGASPGNSRSRASMCQWAGTCRTPSPTTRKAIAPWRADGSAGHCEAIRVRSKPIGKFGKCFFFFVFKKKTFNGLSILMNLFKGFDGIEMLISVFQKNIFSNKINLQGISFTKLLCDYENEIYFKRNIKYCWKTFDLTVPITQKLYFLSKW